MSLCAMMGDEDLREASIRSWWTSPWEADAVARSAEAAEFAASVVGAFERRGWPAFAALMAHLMDRSSSWQEANGVIRRFLAGREAAGGEADGGAAG